MTATIIVAFVSITILAVAAKGSGSLKDCKVDGETITCHNTYADEGLKAMGVDFIEGTWIAIVRDGKIQSYSFTITPESLAKFPPPPEPTPSAPIETLAGSINDVLGTWWSPQAGVQYTLKADGMYRVFANSETVDEGTYAFENGRITWLTSTIFCVDNPAATYDVYGDQRERQICVDSYGGCGQRSLQRPGGHYKEQRQIHGSLTRRESP